MFILLHTLSNNTETLLNTSNVSFFQKSNNNTFVRLLDSEYIVVKESMQDIYTLIKTTTPKKQQNTQRRHYKTEEVYAPC